MKYEALYQDDRDIDESSVAECDSVDEASDALVLYFRRMPENLIHMTSWRIERREDGSTMAFGTTILLN